MLASVNQLIEGLNSTDGISAELNGRFTSPPKILDDRTRRSFRRNHRLRPGSRPLATPSRHRRRI